MKSEDKLKRLIQQVHLDKPGADFTQYVMQEVKEEVVNPELAALLKRVSPEKPLPEFSENVMKALNVADPVPHLVPIISKRTWYAMAAVMFSFFVFLIVSGQGPVSSGATSYLVHAGNLISLAAKQIVVIPPLYVLTFLAVSILLLGDYVLKAKSRQHQPS